MPCYEARARAHWEAGERLLQFIRAAREAETAAQEAWEKAVLARLAVEKARVREREEFEKL